MPKPQATTFSFEQILSWFGRFTPQLKFRLMGLHRELDSTTFDAVLKESMTVFRRASFELAKVPKGAERALYAQALMEVEFEENPVKNVSCGEGCGACCKAFQKQITTDDADLLARAVNSGQVKIDREELSRQAQDSTGSSPCVFLSETGSCKVYAIRPLVCRKYHVTSPRENCSTDQQGVVPRIDIVPEIIASASMSLPDNEIGFMAKLLDERVEKSEVTFDSAI